MEKECTCYKAHLYGRCEACRIYYKHLTEEALKAKEFIDKYPNFVIEYING